MLTACTGAEAAAYSGQRVELAVSQAERANWLTDREAALKAGMCPHRWRRWIETHRDVRVGRPIARNGRLAKNRRLIHRGDLRREIRLSDTGDNRLIECLGAGVSEPVPESSRLPSPQKVIPYPSKCAPKKLVFVISPEKSGLFSFSKCAPSGIVRESASESALDDWTYGFRPRSP